MTDLASLLVERLSSGRWITLAHLARDLDCSRRDAEQGIEEARLAGHAIVASAFGVRLTNDPDELDAYLGARRRRLVTIYAGNRALRRTARRLRERTELTLWSVA